MKKTLLTLLIICSGILTKVYSQAPTIHLEKSYGGTGNDQGNSVQPTNDGGYIVAGFSASNDGDVTGNHGLDDFWVAKLDSMGVIQWQKSLGGTANDEAYYARQTMDSGYVIAGRTSSTDGDVTGNHGGRDIWVVKLDTSGNIQWQKTYGGTANDEARSVEQTSDGGYFITGFTNSTDGDITSNHGGRDAWVIKTDNLGNIQFQETLGGTGNDQGLSGGQTSDGGYILSAQSNSNDGDVSGNHGGTDFWIVKLDNLGGITWQKSLGGSANEQPRGIRQTSDLGYIVTGATASDNTGDVGANHGGTWDSWVVKLDISGAIQWQKVLGGSGLDRTGSVEQTPDGGYVLSGLTTSNDGDVSGNHGGNDGWVVKLNASGTSIDWQLTIGGTGDEEGFKVELIPNGYIVLGTSNSNDGDVTGNHGGNDFWVVKLGPCIGPDIPVVTATTTSLCSGTTSTLNVTSGNLNDATNWHWYSGSCGGTPVGVGTSVTVAPTTTTTYYARGEGGCVSAGVCDSITINVSTTLFGTEHTPLSGPAYACAGSVFTVTGNIVTGATTYSWDGPPGTTFDGGNPSIYHSTLDSAVVTFGPPDGSGYNICLQASNACNATNRKCFWVRSLVSEPSPISGSIVACPSTTGSYSVGSVTGATSYTWTITGNATVSGTGNSATVNFGSGFIFGTLCVTANTPCYSSPPRCITINNITFVPGAISGPVTVCPGTTQTYSIPAAAGASTYNWTLPVNTTGSSATDSITVTFGAGYTGGDISVTITSTCGTTTTPRVKTIGSGVPQRPAVVNSSAGFTGLCGQTATFTCPTVAGATSYTWAIPPGATINNGQNTNSINLTFGNLSSSNLCVTANNSCGSSLARCVSVKGAPASPGPVTLLNGPECIGAGSNNFHATSLTGNVNYTWQLSPASIGTIMSQSNQNATAGNWTGATGNIIVIAANACGNSSASLAITPVTCFTSERMESSVTSTSDVTLNVYPNPAHNLLHVDFTTVEEGNYNIILTDLAGRIVSTTNTSAAMGLNTQEINLDNLAKGMYMLELKGNSYSQKARVVVE